jgi:RalA-binding protein 1
MEGGGRPHEVLHLPRRNPNPLHSPLSNTLIPRDFLSQRPGAQDSPTYGADSLHTPEAIALQSAPSPDVDSPSQNLPSSNMPSIANPHSPRPLHTKDSNNAALHEQRHGDGPSSKKSSAVKKEGEGGGGVSGRNPHVENKNVMRNVSSSAVSGNAQNHLQLSPPASPISVGKDEQKIARAALPRNSSIDSALSSLSSSAEHSNKSSNDSTHADSPEIQHLISAAGSAENLISHLLRDKQHAASQNAQLWKLVDKQRSLLMGLNQDLERAIKDKEKYRKRLKDFQAQSTVPHQSEVPVRDQSRSTVKEVQHESKMLANVNNPPKTETSLSTPTSRSVNSLHSSPLDPAMLPSPLHLLQNQQKLQATDTMESQEITDRRQLSEMKADVVLDNANAPFKNKQARSQGTREAQASFLTSPSPTQAQNVNQNLGATSRSGDARLPPAQVAESMSGAGRSERTLPPTRKAPPAPLKLNQAKPNKTLQEFPPVVPSDSVQSQGIQEIPLSQRGRRKTREEDDHDRELAAQQEQAARSRSSKSSKIGKKKPKPESAIEEPTQAHPIAPQGVPPPTPRQFAVAPPPEATLAGSSSIAAVLSPNSQRTAPVVEYTVTAPPMSPGLPVSPRPVDRPLGSPMPRLPREGAGIPLSPPMSPRGGLPLSPRPPRVAVPPPTETPAVSSPPPTQQSFPQPGSPKKQEMPRPTLTTNLVDGKVENRESPVSPFHGVQIDRSLMDPAYPSLLCPPKALSSLIVRVSSSRLRPKRQSYMALKANDEDPVFTMSTFSRSEGRELWRVEKVIMALPQLDQQMKNVSKFSTRLPERKLFSGHSPAIVDARRSALNHYFGELLEAATDERSALVVCQFLSSDVIEARDDETSLLTPSQRNKPALSLSPESRPVKEGYLTKRGKNFGGWKVRYFILQGCELRYFESPGGTHLGTIKLQNAQIGKQTQTPSPSRTDDDVENQYRHAFLVLEPKRKDSSTLVRHVLCAESDQERDEWVLVLMQHVDNQSDDEQSKHQTSRRVEDGKSHVTGFEAKVKQYSEHSHAGGQDGQTTSHAGTDELKSIGYEQMAAGTAPTIGAPQINSRQDATPSPVSNISATNTSLDTGAAHEQNTASHPSVSISGPKNGIKIQDAGTWGNRPVPQANVKDKKRSMWGFRQRGGSDSTQNAQPVPNAFNNFSQNHHGPTRAVFGLPLAEAVELCPPRGVNVTLPAVVYRCIEYLQAKDAASEEGIFRLSGSNIVIKALRERFNTEGDVNFLAQDQYYDVHAVASLFKSYLRELPSTVLTKEYHLDFLHVLELDDRNKKIAAFNVLVHKLPRVNLALLRALSQYLIEVVNNAEKNKMNVRNMGIVFSPTLNIPAPVFGMFLTDFDAIFGAEPEEAAPIQEQTRTVELSVPTHLAAGDIRSPRHQMFSDLPTPAYNQTTFPQGSTAQQFPMQQSSAAPNQPAPNPPSSTNVSNDTGFIPMQPSYETRTYVSDPQAQSHPQQRYSVVPPAAQRGEYGSMNMMLAPSNAASIKAKRRESSMLFMGMGHRQSSMPRMREDAGRPYHS